MNRFYRNCPECHSSDIEFQPREVGNSSGPPSAWAEDVPARVWCNNCDWEADNPEDYFPEREER